MKPSFFAASEAENRLLPGGTFRSPTPYVIAIMTFVMMIVAAAGLALANAAGIVAGAVEHRYVLQLPDGRDGKLEQAVRAARAVPGVTEVEPVSEQQMRRTLERWVGPGGLGEDLPVPAIVHLDLAPGAKAATVGAALQSTIPNARFIAEQATVQPLLGSLRATRRRRSQPGAWARPRRSARACAPPWATSAARPSRAARPRADAAESPGRSI